MLLGKVDSEGRVDSILMKKIANGLNLKLSANFLNSKTEDGALGADLEYEDEDSTAVCRLQHHPMQGLVGTFNYMQRIHEHLMLGFDFTNLVHIFWLSLRIRSKCLATVPRLFSELTRSTLLWCKEACRTILATSFPSVKELLFVHIGAGTPNAAPILL